MLLSYRNLIVSFGGPKLLDDAGFTIAKRERICLLGRNGEGKSTLLRILNGEIEPDSGEIEAIPGLRVGKLDQEVPATLDGSVFEIVAQGLTQGQEPRRDRPAVATAVTRAATATAAAAVLWGCQLPCLRRVVAEPVLLPQLELETRPGGGRGRGRRGQRRR